MSSGSIVDISTNERKIAERVDSAIAGGLKVSERGGGVRFVDANQVMEFAKMMAVANIGVRKHLRGNPGACLAVCIQAIEWGMSAYAVANKSYLVNDQIAYESQLVQAVILTRAPIIGRIKFEFSGQDGQLRCRAWARLRDEEDEIVEYKSPTWDKIKVKNSPLWKDDPEQQFTYYAGRALCRRHFPDVLLGVYTPDEFVNGHPTLEGSGGESLPPAPRSLNAAFDAIAGGGKRVDAAHTIDHDEDTGEIHDDTEDADDADQPDASQGGDRQDGIDEPQQDNSAPADRHPIEPSSPSDGPRQALMLRLRGKAEKGATPLRLALRNLVPAENEMLTSGDRKYFAEMADEADRDRGRA